ncbi:MAG: hypothetical protein ABFD82_19005 [Syntrophaceae bacterium]
MAERKTEQGKATLLSKSLLFVALVILVASCSTTPNVGFKTYPVSTKLNHKAAIVLDDDFNHYWYTLSVSTPCYSIIKKGVIKNGNMSAKITVGSLNETFFREGFSQLFEKLDVYKSMDDIKNRGQYDLILFPDISIQTSYDNKKALSRKIPYDVGNFSSYMKFSSNVNNYFRLRGLVTYKLNIRNAKNNSEIAVTSGTGEIPGSTNAVYCGETHILGVDGQSIIGNALKLAFINLIKDTEVKLSPLLQDKSQGQSFGKQEQPSDAGQSQSVTIVKPSNDNKPSFLREPSPESPPGDQQVSGRAENTRLSLDKVSVSDKQTRYTSGNANSILEAGETVMLYTRLTGGDSHGPGSMRVEISSESLGVRTSGYSKISKARTKKGDREAFDVQQVLKAADSFRDRQAVLRIKVFGKNNAVVLDERVTVSANPSLPAY